MKIKHRLCVFALLACLSPGAFAQILPPGVAEQAARQQQEQMLREQQRQEQQQRRMQPPVDVRMDDPVIQESSQTLPQNESPCFIIEGITLVGDSAGRFQFALRKAFEKSGFSPGMCLGVQGINALMSLTQNAIIERGYTTTRIFAAPQDLKSGHLELTVVPGRIHSIRYDQDNKENTHAERIGRIANELPASSGDILNLRDLEQGLENLKRVPTAEADIQIVPAESPNESDVIIRWSQRRIPLRVTVNLDDSGYRSTGRYQGSIALSADSPLGLSDLFYVSYNQHIGHAPKQTDAGGHTIKSGTHGYALHYSVPFGNWLWASNYSSYRYHQAVAGLIESYDYNGESSTSETGVTRLLYRDAHRKTYAGLKLWYRDSRNYINDTEIPLQRRRAFGWAVNADHKEYLGKATLGLGLGYKRGTGGGGSLRAPEEATNEGTSRPEIITANIDLNWPFAVGKQTLVYDGNMRAQWSDGPLILLDRLSIGGRYTVRGFDGEQMLCAERGGFWRNTLGWQYMAGHQLYLGADLGWVSGPSDAMLAGHTLAGAVVGMKGWFSTKGRVYYDLFVGGPLSKPKHFKTDSYTAGFTLNYSL
jgi:hemolysin activation/secretion protein